MKNKKSKIIVPALGLILLSTAASISGSVAWFTANRTAQIKTGEFTVVKTGDDLEVGLTAGVGISTVDAASEIKSITVNASYNLTDSSFDHTNTTCPYVVEPDVPREKVLHNYAINSNTLATQLVRGANTYSAYTWKMTFTVTFAESATDDVGLFLNLASKDTYMREKVTYADTHTLSATEAGTYYSDEAFTSGEVEKASGSTLSAGTYYTLPNTTGKAFRIAFVPTDIGGTGTGSSTAYAKVWAANASTADETKFVNAVAEGSTLAGTAYDTATVKLSGTVASHSYGTAAAGSGKVLMKKGDATPVPGDNTLSDSTALSGNSNYLGFFKKDAGKTVILEYTCIAWYDGTHPEIKGSATEFEEIVASMRFGLSNLNA